MPSFCEWKLPEGALQETAHDTVGHYFSVPDAIARHYELNGRYRLAQRFGRGAAEHPFVCVVSTMYNEGPGELDRTLSAVAQSVSDIAVEFDVIPSRVICVVVQDGLAKIDRDTLARAAELGVVDATTYHKALDAQRQGTADAMHVWESAPTMRDTRLGGDARTEPLQTLFLAKRDNARKLDSHMWAFHAVLAELQPEYCVLLDMGTHPAKGGIAALVREMVRDPLVAGTCGEIAPDSVDDRHKGGCTADQWCWTCKHTDGTARPAPRWCHALPCFPITAMQIFEYAASNYMDKSLEDLLGYITVLPGAFSAYRWSALAYRPPGTGDRLDPKPLGQPLEVYFEGLRVERGERRFSSDAWKGNLYLAEDRMLCTELLLSADRANKMSYVAAAIAYVDMPATVSRLLAQRRRWFNGSFFAGMHAISQAVCQCRLVRTRHSVIRKTLLLLEFVFQAANIALTFVSPSIVYVVFYVIFAHTSMVPPEYSLPALDVTYLGITTLTILMALSIKVSEDSATGDSDATDHPDDSRATRKARKAFRLAEQQRNRGARSCTRRMIGLLNLVGIAAWAAIVMEIVQSPVSLADKAVAAWQERDTVAIATAAVFPSYYVVVAAHLCGRCKFNRCISTSIASIAYLLGLVGWISFAIPWSFANLHDLSWGTKGISAASEQAPRRAKAASTGAPSSAGDGAAGAASSAAAAPAAPESRGPTRLRAFTKSQQTQRILDAKTRTMNLAQFQTYLLWFRFRWVAAFVLVNVAAVWSVHKFVLGPSCAGVRRDSPAASDCTDDDLKLVAVFVWVVLGSMGCRVAGSLLYVCCRCRSFRVRAAAGTSKAAAAARALKSDASARVVVTPGSTSGLGASPTGSNGGPRPSVLMTTLSTATTSSSAGERGTGEAGPPDWK